MPKPDMARWRLLRWRQWAYTAAVAKGARRACHLCKRATMGAASVEIRPPWRTVRGKQRCLCSQCWRELTQWVDQTEYDRNHYHEAIDWVQSDNMRGRPKRDSST